MVSVIVNFNLHALLFLVTLFVCVGVYVCMCVFVYVRVYMRVWIYVLAVCVCACLWMYADVCVYVCVCTCVHVWKSFILNGGTYVLLLLFLQFSLARRNFLLTKSRLAQPTPMEVCVPHSFLRNISFRTRCTSLLSVPFPPPLQAVCLWSALSPN